MSHKFASPKQHQRSINTLLLGSFLSTLGIFVAVPLVGIHAVEFFKLSPSQIGILASIWPLTVFTFSFLAGMYSDQWGHLRVIRLALILYISAFLVMATASSVPIFAVGLFLFGLGKSFFESSMRAALTCITRENEREKYFRLRYLLQNLGCVIGPLLGVGAYKYAGALSFSLTSFFSSVFLAVTFIFLRSEDFRRVHLDAKPSLLRSLTVFQDRRFLRWTLSGMLILVAYGAIEALMPSVIAMSNGTRPNYGLLVSLNAVTVIVLQSFLLGFLKKISLVVSLIAGTLLMFIGFQFFMVEQNIFYATLFATILYSAGESLLFPCFEVLIDRIAPRERKALYFGAGEVKQIGFFIGPVAGGLLLENQGSAALFIACGVCCAISGALLYSLRKSESQSVEMLNLQVN